MGVVDTLCSDCALEQYRCGFWNASGHEPGVYWTGRSGFIRYCLLLP